MHPALWKFKTYQRQFDELKQKYLFGATDADLRECERNRTFVVGGYLFIFIIFSPLALFLLSTPFWLSQPQRLGSLLFWGVLFAGITAKVAFHLWEFFSHPAALYHFDKLTKLAYRLAGEREERAWSQFQEYRRRQSTDESQREDGHQSRGGGEHSRDYSEKQSAGSPFSSEQAELRNIYLGLLGLDGTNLSHDEFEERFVSVVDGTCPGENPEHFEAVQQAYEYLKQLSSSTFKQTA